MATDRKSYGLTLFIIAVTIVPVWSLVLWYFGIFAWFAAVAGWLYQLPYKAYFDGSLNDLTDFEVFLIYFALIALLLGGTRAKKQWDRAPTMTQILFCDRKSARRYDGYL